MAAVGIATIDAVGDVYNLKTASDIIGTYAAVSAGLSLGKGVAGLTMRNDRGVVINLRSVQQGVQLNLGVDWLHHRDEVAGAGWCERGRG